MVPWSLGNTWATRGSTDLIMTVHQAHLPVPIIWVNFRRGRGRGYNNNHRNLKRLSGCCSCCCCVSNRRLGFYGIMSFAIAKFLRVTILEQSPIQSSIVCPMFSKHWVVNMQTSTFPGCICPINIPRGGNIRLFPKKTSKGFSSKVAASIAWVLSKAFSGSGSKTRQGVPAKSNQFVRELQFLSYWSIRIWRSVQIRTDIKSSKLE